MIVKSEGTKKVISYITQSDGVVATFYRLISCDSNSVPLSQKYEFLYQT